MIISDLTISTSDFETDFLREARGSVPAGHGSWRPFVVGGDYLTEDMLVRYRFFTFAQTSYTVNTIDVTIDVPDIIERKQDETITGVTSITFARPFHAPPQVVQTQFGVTGGTGVEYVVFENVTKTGCDIRITDGTSNFNGDVDWVAHGY